MDLKKIIHPMIFYLVLGHNVSSLILQTEDVDVNLQENDNIILNCTYQKDEKDFISDGGIRWQKQIEGTYRNIAKFSPPGSALKPFIEREMQHSYNNRTELIAPNTSLAAVMIIKNPICSDEGTYRCMIEYITDSSAREKTSSSVVSFNANAREPNEFEVLPNEVIENQSLSLTCSADVGSPRGYVQIWKTAEDSNAPELIYTSNFTNNKTDKCTEFINVTTTYTVTRKDNGAVFRCSSQNSLTQRLGPSTGSKKITVFYPVESQPSTSSSASLDVPAKKKDVQDSGKKKRKLTILELEERNLSLENDKLQEEIEKLKDERQLIVAKKSYYDLKFQILCNNNPEVVAQMLKSNEC